MAETSSLLNCRTGYSVPRVRISSPPPKEKKPRQVYLCAVFFSFRQARRRRERCREAGSHRPFESLVKLILRKYLPLSLILRKFLPPASCGGSFFIIKLHEFTSVNPFIGKPKESLGLQIDSLPSSKTFRPVFSTCAQWRGCFFLPLNGEGLPPEGGNKKGRPIRSA